MGRRRSRTHEESNPHYTIIARQSHFGCGAVFHAGYRTNNLNEVSTIMLWVILIVLLLLWLVGFYGGFVTTSLIHLLLVAAVVVLALNLFRRRNPA